MKLRKILEAPKKGLFTRAQIRKAVLSRKPVTKSYMTCIQALYGDSAPPPSRKVRSGLKERNGSGIKPGMPTEAQDQARLVKKLRDMGFLVMAIPNSGKRSLWAGEREKALGLHVGAPDLIIPYAKNGYHGLFIEMKRLKGGVVKPEQQQCIDALNVNGYLAVIMRGYDEAWLTVEKYLGINL